MKTVFQTFFVILWVPICCHSQGTFTFYNPTAQTRLGFRNGPLAGPGILGQPLVSVTVDSLSPMGQPLEHDALGAVGPVLVSVPGVFAGENVYVQMAAWDGTVWGSSFASVPANQIGYTDVVSLVLTAGGGVPPAYPLFTQPAVVPPIPEPGTALLIAFGSVALLTVYCRRWHG